MSKNKEYLNIDKLEICYTATAEIKTRLRNGVEFVNDFIIITRQFTKDNNLIYHNVELTNGLHFGEITFGNKYFNKDLIYFSIDNRILYTEYLPFINDVSNTLGLEFHSISKFDLAFDKSTNMIKKFYSVMNNETYDLMILNKRYGINDEIGSLLHISSGTRKNPRKNKSFYINNAEGGLSLCCYNKTKEIHDKNDKKAYIFDVLQMKRIYRLEIRTEHHILRDTLNNLNMTEFYLYQLILNRCNEELFAIYKDLLSRLIEVKYKRNTICLLDFFE